MSEQGDARRKMPPAASEYEMLDASLEYCQQTVLHKIEGLSDADLRRSVVPSGITPLGVVKHLAYVHRWWFRAVFAGEAVTFPWSEADPDADWRIEPDDTTDAIIALYNDEVAQARAITAAASIDDVVRDPKAPQAYTLRWLMPYMIQEIARHNGHLDILRELIDGRTGR
jgi:hypothetical protein